jgi:hypothetical protein
MEGLSVLYGFYIMPAAVLFGTTIVAVRLLKRPRLLPIEYVSWLLPGLTYWLLSEPLHLEQAFRGKTLGNLGEPALVAIIAWLVFVARLVFAKRFPESATAPAFWCIGLSNLAAFGVLALTPMLPE